MSIQTEIAAVSKLTEALAKTDLLTPEIPTNDRSPSWDGFIYVYSKIGRKKEHLLRRVPVQVKGHIRKGAVADKVSHSISFGDLNNYAKEGGVLFIKACVDKESNNEAFYCGALLRGDIEGILNGARPGSKKKTVWLNRFSVEKDELEAFLTGFADALNKLKDDPKARWEDYDSNGFGKLAADPLPDVVRPLELYRYDSGAVGFVGREKELEAIREFLTSPLPISWWGIAAPGGAGKSRLAYELKKQLDEEQIWETVLVKEQRIDELPAMNDKEFSAEYPGPTLFIIDYAQQYAEKIAKWMSKLSSGESGRDERQRIRFLLLDRANGEKETDAPTWEKELLEHGKSDRLRDLRYKPSMLLSQIDDELLARIMCDFARYLAAAENAEDAEDALTEEEARELVEALGNNEHGLLKHPLFAMMMADIYIHEGGNADEWSMEELLEKPIYREMRILSDLLEPYGSSRLKSACHDILRIATVCSSNRALSLERLNELCPESMSEIASAEEKANLCDGELMLRAGLCDSECENAVGMTPDLFGEYLLFHRLCNRDNESQHSKKIDSFYATVLEEFDPSLEFFKRMLKDFGHLMAKDDGLRKLVFPEAPKLDDEKTPLYARMLKRLFEEPNEKALRLIPANSLIALAEGRSGNTRENVVIWSDAGAVCRDMGSFDRALGFLLKDMETSEEVQGKDHPNTATTYNNIASLYQSMGEFDKALEYYLKALTVMEKVLGKNHPNTAATYNNIALLYQAKGKFDKALEYYLKALTVMEKVLGKDHPNTAVTYNNIALLYKAMGEFDMALDYNLKALAVREKVLGKEHPDTATTYNNIALLYKAMGEFDMALDYNLKALAVREKVLGKEHPDTATTYNNIALLYKAMGEFDMALDYNLKALAVREKVLGKEHPDTATTYNNIALLYKAMGEFDKALDYNLKALAVGEKVLGKEHPDTATTYNNIGILYLERDKADEALDYLRSALIIFEAKLGQEHPHTVGTRRAVEAAEMLQ